MELTSLRISRNLPEFPRIKKLFETSFPKNERYPLWLLAARAACKDADFLAYYDESVFCGITYTVRTENTLFVLYIAVNDEIRSKGYGTAILSQVVKLAEGRQVVLNVEDPDPAAENNGQRERRVSFYKRNGFYDTGYRLIEKILTHQVMCNKEDFSPDGYTAALKKLSCGFYTPHLERLFSRTSSNMSAK